MKQWTVQFFLAKQSRTYHQSRKLFSQKEIVLDLRHDLRFLLGRSSPRKSKQFFFCLRGRTATRDGDMPHLGVAGGVWGVSRENSQIIHFCWKLRNKRFLGVTRIGHFSLWRQTSTSLTCKRGMRTHTRVFEKQLHCLFCTQVIFHWVFTFPGYKCGNLFI